MLVFLCSGRELLGGVIVLWNTNTVNLISSSSGEFSVTFLLQMRDGGPSWAFTGVYGPQARVDKLRMLEELGRVRDGWHGPWCLGGDFNEILHASERNTGVCSGNVKAEFRIFINQMALLDLPLRGGEYVVQEWCGCSGFEVGSLLSVNRLGGALS